MPTDNVDAIYDEYPFLSRFKPRVKVGRALVLRFNEKELARSAHVSTAFESWDSHLLLLDAEGERVTRVRGGSIWDFLKYERGETIGQALARIGDEAKRVRYAIALNSNPFTLWKLPAGFDNAAEWLKAVTVKAIAEMGKE